MNLQELIEQRARGHEQIPALEFPDGGSWSHADLAHAVRQAVTVLASVGVREGDRVLAQVEKSPWNIALYLGALRAGAVYVPLNSAYTSAELEYFLQDAEPALLVCAPARQGDLQPLAEAAGVPAVMSLDQQGGGSFGRALDCAAPAEAPAVSRQPDDLAAILYTSGTTGRSKGAMLTHGNLRANAETLRRIWGWQSDDRLLHALPLYHVHGLFVALHCALLEPSPILLLPRFDVDAVLEGMARATVFMGVPTHYTRLLADSRLDAQRAARMRLFVSGSAPLLPETFAEFERRVGMRILERYGMSETGMITSNPLAGERVAGTVGFPLPGVEVRLRTPAGACCKPGEVGVLQVRGPNVFAGYWKQPERTAAEFDDGWFVTGDLAEQDDDGRVSIVGRHKDLIITGGLNVYPREIEAVLNARPDIIESAVIGVPHADFGEGIVAIVVPDGNWSGEAATIAELKRELAGFKVPRRIVAASELPRNAMGKVQKNLLRETHAEAFRT